MGATLASGVIASTRRGRDLLHSAGLLNSPNRNPPASSIPVQAGTLPSGRRFAHARTGRRPVLSGVEGPRAIVLCLHGRGEDERFAFDTMRVHEFSHELGLELLVASIDGGSHSYWHARSSGIDPLEEAMETLLPQLPPAPVFVLGWSMGGYGALLSAIEHPGVVAGVIASSAALWERGSDCAPGAFDSEDDFAAHDVWKAVERLGQFPVRIDCGEGDPFMPMNLRLLSQLPSAEGGIQPGFHDARFWRWVLPEQLRFIERTLPKP